MRVALMPDIRPTINVKLLLRISSAIANTWLSVRHGRLPIGTMTKPSLVLRPNVQAISRC